MAFDLASGVERQRYRLRTLCLVRAACALETGPFVLEFYYYKYHQPLLVGAVPLLLAALRTYFQGLETDSAYYC